MSTIRITKEFSFEGAHALLDYDGKCRHIHGHSYKLQITLKGSPMIETDHPKRGMVLDFTELKKLVNNLIIEPFDHALLLRSGSPIAEEISKSYQNVVIMNFQPTCENLTIYFANLIKQNLPQGLTLHRVKLHETATSFVEWVADDNE
ncbi:MAG: 6-carboxytetrahydropterin synthase [Bacteroidales bacterium]|jgi:6-pyruvoyltetrahydropterin/6-carboxytetrahydropterin synthase